MFLSIVKTALRVTTDHFDDEIEQYIDAALADLSVSAGVMDPNTSEAPTNDTTDTLIKQAVITYVRMHFGSPEDYARLERSYNEQKSQLKTATGYTVWSEED